MPIAAVEFRAEAGSVPTNEQLITADRSIEAMQRLRDPFVVSPVTTGAGRG